MPIIDPLRNPFYESGGLVQQCQACEWAQRGHKIEIVDCPLCGEPLGASLALTFGGIGVVHLARNFDIYTRCGGWVSLEQNDLPEIVQFICRHAVDRRTGTLVRDVGSPRRIGFRQQLKDHIFSRE